MELVWGTAARAVIDRSLELASERQARVSTLHLAAALMEEEADAASILKARGVRANDLRTAARVHAESPGTFERIQKEARRLASSTDAEPTTMFLLAAALRDRGTALSAMLGQLGCESPAVADEILKSAGRTPRPRATRGAIIHSGSTRKPAPEPVTRHTAPAPAARHSATAPARRNAIVHGVAIPPSAAPVAKAVAAPRNGSATASTVTNATSKSRQLALEFSPIDPTRNGTTVAQRRVVSSSAPNTLRLARVAVGRAKSDRTPHDLDPRTFPALAMFVRNLSADCARGTLEPVVGRDAEVQRILDASERREGRGALIVGPAGVGKSTVVRALARSGGSRAVLSLRYADIVAQARTVQGNERIRKLADELLSVADRVIVALDPVAPWFTQRDAPEEVILQLRSALAGGRIAWVGTATIDEARKLAEAEPWVERNAVRIELEEPPRGELNEIVRAHAPSLGEHHGVVADAPVLDRAAELADRYLSGRAQPDRALHVVDLALARARRGGMPALTRDHVASVVAELGHIPLDRVAATDSERMLGLEEYLGRRVVGHNDALRRMSNILRRNAAGFRGARPIGTFLFLGPTGVGKTESAKAIAEALFPGENALTRFDMAEFAEPHAVARLIGAPPGYVGYQEGGQLTEAIRRRPYSVILLDEIEKAHLDVLESLLSLLDEGRLTDGRGRTADFRNAVVVMTSNLGAHLYERANQTRTIGFAGVRNDATGISELDGRVLEHARSLLPPELWNRIDDPIVFGPLDRDEVAEIARRMLNASFAKLEEQQGVRLIPTPHVIDMLLERGGFDASLGARPMRRAIARHVEAPVAEAVLRGTLRSGDFGTVDVLDGKVVVLRAAE